MTTESETRKSWHALIGADRFEVLPKPTDAKLYFNARCFGGVEVLRDKSFVLAHRGDELPDFLALPDALQYGVLRRHNDGSLSFSIDFGGAIRAMKEGARVARAGWNGKGMWLNLQVPDANSKMTLPYIYMKTADDQQVPWLASQTDMLAEDWCILDGEA